MSLPTIPAGTNPYTVYYEALHATFYNTPSSGFKVRLGVLFGLTALAIVLAVVNWVLLVLEAKRHGRGSPYWLFRLASRQSGRYIVTNGKLVLSLLTVITGAVMLGTTVDLWNVFVDQKSQSRSSIIRSFSVLPLLLQGWLMPWASLQASLLASEHNNNTFLRPWVANTLFAGLGGVIFLGVVASGVVNSQAGQAVWNQAFKMLGQLKQWEAEWQPSENSLQPLIRLAPEFQELQKRVNYNRNVQLGCIASWIVIPVIVILVNLASLRLSRLLRKQVQFNIDQFLGPIGTETQLSRRSGGSNGHIRESVSAPIPEKHGDTLLPVAHSHKRGSKASEHYEAMRQKLRDGRMSISHLSRGELMKVANRRASAPDKERIRNIQALQKAEKDLMVTSYVVLVAICAILGLCIYFLYVIASNKLSTLGWASQEAVLTSTIWIYDIALDLVLISLIWFHWTSRSIKSDSESSTTFFGQPTTLDPMMSVGSNAQYNIGPTGERRGTVTIDFGGGVIGHPGGGMLGTTSGLSAPQLSSISQQTSKELDSYAWGPRDGEAEVLADGEDTDEEQRPALGERRESGRTSPTTMR
ncbi:hypothetical protein JCM10207_006807 [Rhodosporidiobolus poonsookiae]